MTLAQWQAIIDQVNAAYGPFLRGEIDWQGQPVSAEAQANNIRPMYPQVPLLWDDWVRQGLVVEVP